MSYSKLDADQIIKKVYDESTETLKTTGGSGPSGEVEVTNPPGESLDVINQAQLVPEKYDEINLTYVTSGNGIGEIETAIYKLSGNTVAVLTLTYNGDNKLSSVVRS